jgi:hypothetical protein
MPYHSPLIVGSVTYAFDHLEPHELTVPSNKAAKDLIVRIRYNDHCFSEGYDPEKHPDGCFFLPGSSTRVFDETRYSLSLGLPGLMSSLAHPQATVEQPSSRRNWLRSVTIQSGLGPYHIFFELRRAPRGDRQDLNLIVESAYPQGAYAAPQTVGEMRFNILVGKVYLGEPTTTRR